MQSRAIGESEGDVDQITRSTCRPNSVRCRIGRPDRTVVRDLEEFAQRLSRLEDESAIRRVILRYGPAADAGAVDRAASVWFEDGEYDWDAGKRPFADRAAIGAMLSDRGHQSLISTGVAHFAGPPLIRVSDSRATATALTYSLIMRRDAEHDRFYLWRVSVAHWELERRSGEWGVHKRTNRLLDETGAGRMLLGASVGEFF